MKKETWLDIVGYEGLYQISNKGRVRSIDRIVLGKNFSKRKIPGKLIALNLYSKSDQRTRVDYRVFLNKEGGQKTHFVSRLVATAFLGDKRYLQVNHIDGDPLNNKVENLEWVTQEENMKHASLNGLIPTRKIIARKGNESLIFNSLTEASNVLNIDIGSISMVLNHKRNRKSAGGYIFLPI